MEIFLVLIINPYFSRVPEILLFKTKFEAVQFIINEIDSQLENQKTFVSGLKGDKDTHMANYKKFLEEYNEVYFYGEYRDYFTTYEPYEVRYRIEQKELNT